MKYYLKTKKINPRKLLSSQADYKQLSVHSDQLLKDGKEITNKEVKNVIIVTGNNDNIKDIQELIAITARYGHNFLVVNQL